MFLVYLIAAALVLIAVGSFAFGGVFTIVTVPILIAAGAVAFGWRILGRMLQERAAASKGGPAGVPSSREASYDPRQVVTSPQSLVDARRENQ